MDTSAIKQLATSRIMVFAAMAVGVALMLVSAVLFEAPDLMGRDKVLTDFDAFYVAGILASEGQAASAYDIQSMVEAQRRIVKSQAFLPWTYPPPFTLFVSVLAELPIGAAFLLFTASTFALYLWVLWRIAGRYFPAVVIAMLPTIVLIARTGQNGFLTGSLIGLFMLAFLQRNGRAGVPLGLMIIKPHLAVGISLLTMLERRWCVVASAALVVVLALVVSTAAFGIPIWPAFIDGVRESGQFLVDGYYPLFRMTSAYAFLRSVGLSASAAMSLHTLIALIAVSLTAWLWRSKAPPRLLASAICVTSLLISPYNYDYDLTILGVGLAFAMPLLIRKARPGELVTLLILCWFSTGYGIGLDGFLDEEPLGASHALSLIAPALFISVALAARTIIRPRVATRSKSPEIPAVRPAC